MALMNVSVKHGQTLDAASSHFERGVEDVSTKYAKWIQGVEWSPDRRAATFSGQGYVVTASVDADEVHVRGHIPLFAKIFSGPLESYLRQMFQKPSETEAGR